MFNLVKKNNEQQATNAATAQSAQSSKAENVGNEKSTMDSTNPNRESEKKKVHGQDGLCCGSCGGE